VAVKAWLKGEPNHGVLLKVWGLDKEMTAEDLSDLVLKISMFGSE
jgi:hypothetical protein